MTRTRFTILLSLVATGLLAVIACSNSTSENSKTDTNGVRTDRVVKSASEWRESLTEEEFEILREGGTERAFNNEFWDNHNDGTYTCAGCGLPLFASTAKFESGTGWPSFSQPIIDSNVTKVEDRSWGMVRIEVRCARCDGHLGHVFEDGPQPTGLRYCLNSVALDFRPDAPDGSPGDSI